MCGTPLAGTPSAMMLPTAERATQILPTCVAGVSQKTNATVPAVRHAAAQFGMRLHHRVQRGLILTDKRIRAVVLMPIRAKREKLLDSDDKKARLSVTIRIEFCTPSSYLVDAKASRGRARFFCAPPKNSLRPSAQTIQHGSSTQALSLAAPTPIHHARFLQTLLERRNRLFSFPSSGSIDLSRDGSIQLSVIERRARKRSARKRN